MPLEALLHARTKRSSSFFLQIDPFSEACCYALGGGCNNNNNIYYIGIIDNNNNYTLQTDYWLRITLQTLSCPYLGKTPKMGVSNGMEASGSQEMSQSRGLKMMNNTMKLLCQLIELRTV